MGAKSSQNLLDEIEKSKSRDLAPSRFRPGHPPRGRTAGPDPGRALRGPSTRWPPPRPRSSTQVEDVGPKVAESIVFFFRQPENADLIRRLREAGLNFESQAESAGAGPLAGKTFVLTGTLAGMERDKARELIESRGGR